MGNAAAGWYPYGGGTIMRWWDGVQWSAPATGEEPSGNIRFQIPQSPPSAGLFVYENEAWKIIPAGLGTSLGGSLAGARAEVVVQNQLQVGTRVRGPRTLGSTLFHVTSPTFEFTFSLDSRKNQTAANLSLLNQAAEFINVRGRELAAVVTHSNVSESALSVVSVADELAKFSDLRDRGIVSEDEFQAKKAELLS